MLTEISRRQKIFVMLGSMLAMLLGALDQTIVGTAMPKIVQELNGLEHLSWVFTAYMLTATISVPIVGKLSDIYGRKIFYLIGIVVFILGSVLSGLSQNMGELIGFRALQGLGTGFIMANAFAVIGDLFTPAERGRWQGVFGAVFGLSSVIGPTLGGYLTDNFSWRWNFYINVPLGILAFVVIWWLMPKIGHHLKDHSIDYLGAASLTLTLVPLLLGLVWGGNQYPWNSWQEYGLFASAALFLIGFLAAEHYAKHPILPLHFFKSNIFSLSSLIVFLTGVAMFGTILYIPLFAQSVIGISATNSGIVITPMTAGIVLSSIVTGQILSRTGKYKILAILGLAIVVVAMYLLAQINVQTSYWELVWRMVLMGVGLGMNFPIYTLIVQNAFEHQHLGVVTASNQLFRSLGATVGVAIMGSVLNNSLAQKLGDLSQDPFVKLAGRFGSGGFDVSKLDINSLQGFLTPSVQELIKAKLSALPQPVQAQAIDLLTQFIDRVKDALALGIAHVFAVAMWLMLAAFIVAFFLKEIPLRTSHYHTPGESGKALADAEAVIPEKSNQF